MKPKSKIYAIKLFMATGDYQEAKFVFSNLSHLNSNTYKLKKKKKKSYECLKNIPCY